MKKTYLLIFGLFLIILAGCARNGLTSVNNAPAAKNEPIQSASEEPDKPSIKEVIKDTTEAVAEVVAKVEGQGKVTGLPDTFSQEVPFARQAPFGQWSNPFYEDACEEASLVMVQKFFAGLPLDEKIMQTELDKVEPWELERFGENLSVDTNKVAIMGREFFGLQIEVSTEVTIEKIKKELVAGNLIILPLTGRDLHNPNFTGAGPLYHMLVVIGYDRNEFITNDPGTRLGKDYKYPYQTLIDATHDWNNGDIYNGKKLMLILKKP